MNLPQNIHRQLKNYKQNLIEKYVVFYADVHSLKNVMSKSIVSIGVLSLTSILYLLSLIAKISFWSFNIVDPV